MNADEFAKLWKNEKDSMVAMYFNGTKETAVGAQIESLRLADSDRAILREIIDGALSDAFYGLLLGLDGCASIGGVQQTYQIRDEDGTLISDCGDLEGSAYEHFHGSSG